MMTNIDKRIRAEQFRERLTRAMKDAAMTQSALARHIHVERSTVSQVLNDEGARLPNAQFVGECAAALNVSADWLLGLSHRPENASDLLAQSLELTRAPRALIDEQIFAWHKEAAGYKIRHVPASLPDMFKSDAFLEWEYAPHLGRTTQQAINASRDRLDWMRTSQSDYEIAFPLHEVKSLVHRTGYYPKTPKPLFVEVVINLMEPSRGKDEVVNINNVKKELEYAELKRYIDEQRKLNKEKQEQIKTQMSKYYRRRNRFVAMFLDSDR